MRALAGMLLLTAAVIHLLLGSVYLLSSRYQPPAPHVRGQAASPLERDEREHFHEQRDSTRALFQGLGVLLLALAEIAGSLLAFLRRAPRLVLGIAGGGTLAIAGLMLLEGPLTVAAISAGLLALALGCAFLSDRARGRAPAEG